MIRLKLLIFHLLLLPLSTTGQDKGYEPIKEDTTFEPYVSFDETTGNYIIGYLKSAETGKIYETQLIPPTKLKPEVSVFVELNSDGFAYKYTFRNGNESRQDISSLELEIKDQFKGAEFPENWYHRNNRVLPFVRIVHKITEMPVWKEGDPIEFESDIQKGEELQFVIFSDNPPSLVTSYVSGQPKELGPSFVIPPSYKVRKLLDSLRTNVVNERGLKLKTIGPQTIPDNISGKDLLDSLHNYQAFSCDTSWISNQGLCRSLKAKLENVERQLDQGNTNAASGSLKAFINEVEAQKGEQLSPEAYALLYYNGRYLLDRLKQ